MKPSPSIQGNRALALFELLVVLLIILVLALGLVLLASAAVRSHRSYGLDCINNLRQTGLAYHIWAGDNGGKYPMDISVTKGGAMELVATGNVAATFQVMSNYLCTPVDLHCPLDRESIRATNFGPSFTAKCISYFIGVDAHQSNPQSILLGDDNLEAEGKAVQSGISFFAASSDVAWTASRHRVKNKDFWMPDPREYYGTIGLADGSARWVNPSELRQALQQTGLASNHFIIP